MSNNKNAIEKPTPKARARPLVKRLARSIASLLARKPKFVDDPVDSPKLAQKVSSGIRKPERRPLQRDLPPASEYPIDALGDILGGAARAIHESIQAPLAICGNSVLAAAHLAAQAHADIEVDGRTSPVSEFFITVGQSGERKSTVDNAALKEHRAHEKALHERFNASRTNFAAQGAVLKTTGTDDASRPGHCADSSGEVGVMSAPPLAPILICEEPTFEGLIKNLANGQPSQGLFSDEGGLFLGGHAMSQEKATSTLAGFSKLWDSKPIDRIRAGEGALKIFGRRFSFHLMVQPSLIAGLMSDPMARDQGFLSRCLIVIPESTVGGRFYRQIDLTHSAPMKAYYSCMRHLLEKVSTVDDANDPVLRSQLNPRKLSLTGGAKTIYMEFHDQIEREMAGKLRELQAFANKAPEHLLRIAGTLALVDDPETTSVSEVHARAGQALVTYFLHEAYRLDELSRQDPQLRLAQHLLEWFLTIARPISLVEIYQCGPNALRNAKRARQIAGILVEHGYLAPVSGTRYRGQARAEGWTLIA